MAAKFVKLPSRHRPNPPLNEPIQIEPSASPATVLAAFIRFFSPVMIVRKRRSRTRTNPPASNPAHQSPSLSSKKQ